MMARTGHRGTICFIASLTWKQKIDAWHRVRNFYKWLFVKGDATKIVLHFRSGGSSLCPFNTSPVSLFFCLHISHPPVFCLPAYLPSPVPLSSVFCLHISCPSVFCLPACLLSTCLPSPCLPFPCLPFSRLTVSLPVSCLHVSCIPNPVTLSTNEWLWANHSFFAKFIANEWFAQGHSFVLSDPRKLLTVTHLNERFWANE